jgi:hypothetical protein
MEKGFAEEFRSCRAAEISAKKLNRGLGKKSCPEKFVAEF